MDFRAVHEIDKRAVAPFGRRPRRRAFLGDTDQDHAARFREAVAVALGHRVLAFPLAEFHPGDVVLIGPRAQSRLEGRRDLPEHRGRGDLLAAAPHEEIDHAARGLQSRHIGIEIEPVDAADFQGHVVFDNLGDVGHGTSSWFAPEEISPNRVREKASASLGRCLCGPQPWSSI